MTYALLIQNRAGVTVDYAEVTDSVEFTTNRTGSPGKLSFTIHKPKEVYGGFNEGDPVRFSVDGTNIFFGFIFRKEKDRWGHIAITCYDQLRYLKSNESYCFVGLTAGEIIKKIAGDFQLNVGSIDDTGFAIPYFVKEDKSCLDIISEAVQLTTMNTGKIFVFYDDAGKLALKESKNLLIDSVLGDKSLVTDYTYTTDIDKETYSKIKLVRPNKETGKADVYIVEDSAAIKKWGILQLYETVDENMNAAQITEQAKTMLSYYNRTLRTLSLPGCLGVVGLRAGAMVAMNIPNLGDISLTSFVLLEKVNHKFKNDMHTMDIEIRITSPK
ncbi:MAG: hypothetical protein LBN00_06240 [Oscillospiraceae bacterium]|jgi:hypothetical protein|nr:hypothetical protein [Oscillospiraceae bacterium]